METRKADCWLVGVYDDVTQFLVGENGLFQVQEPMPKEPGQDFRLFLGWQAFPARLASVQR